jgi:hypothetical protein
VLLQRLHSSQPSLHLRAAAAAASGPGTAACAAAGSGSSAAGAAAMRGLSPGKCVLALLFKTGKQDDTTGSMTAVANSILARQFCA